MVGKQSGCEYKEVGAAWGCGRLDGKRWVLSGVVAAILLVSMGACRSLGEFVNPAAEDAGEPVDSLLAYSVYLVGDGGDGMTPALRLLDTFLAEEDSNSAVVFLGDNIYPSGLPPVTDPARDEAEAKLLQQLELVEDFAGQIAFVPGNHDWGGDGLGGDRGRVLRQEDYVEAFLNRGNTFVPDNGLPGPVEIPLNDKLVLVALDTQWWLEPEKVYGNTGLYQLELEGEFLLALDDVLRRHADKHVVVAAHHPVFSNGEHGGYFPTSEDLYLLLPFSRRFLGTPQDLSNRKYRLLREGLLSVFEQHDHLVYAAGHEHNLQYFPHGSQHYVVSGSLTKLGYVAHNHGEDFAAEAYGLSRVNYFRDGSAWLEFWTPVGDGTRGERIYATRIHEPDEAVALPEPISPALAQGNGSGEAEGDEETSPDEEAAEADTTAGTGIPKVDPLDYATSESDVFIPSSKMQPYDFYADSTVVVSAGLRYDVGWLREQIFGEGYREVWETPVRVPVIDLERTAGGLTPVQRGGGLQTISLRMDGADGASYTLRSIDKDPSLTVPDYLRETVAEDVVQDQISAINPYAAFVIPPLADAAGVYHTTPTLVVVPYSDRLGAYEEEFGGMLALFERRPDEDQSDAANFGNSENVKGTEAMLEDVTDDNDESVAIREYIRARLFDMLIGDWDRHADQWRWAEFENEYDKYYVPIPRDRDFTFFRFGGLPARLAPHLGDPKMRRFSHFGPDYGDVLGLNYNGAAMDRRLTGPAGREVWLEVADSLEMAITDQVIEEAVRMWPEPIFEIEGERIIEDLKARRDKLPEVAADYYDLLAHIVDLFGSNNHERFEIRRIDGEQLEVIAYKTSSEGTVERELYRRTFLAEETGEIRIYGFDGNDFFHLSGDTRNGINVRIIGGEGGDTIVDDSSEEGIQGNTFVYDTNFGTTYVVDEDVNLRLSPSASVHAYDPLRFEFNVFKPVTYFGYNENDGVFLGGGVRIIQPGFRKYPYDAAHTIAANFAIRSRAYNLLYEGDYIQVWKDWDADVLAEALAVQRFRSFYGLGNDTPQSNRDLFDARIQWVSARPTLRKSIAPHTVITPFSSFSIGPRIEYANVEPPQGIDESEYVGGFSPEDLTDKYFVGAYASYDVDGRDTLAVTESGVRWANEALFNVAVRGTDERYVHLGSELSYYYTFNFQPRTTLAFRVGGAHNFGEFAFFQANSLGGDQNLRGYSSSRFSGRSSLFTNAEARVKLFDFNAYLTKGEAGAIGFVDTGRVWWDNDNSRLWHAGYGGGLWVIPFYQVAVVSTVAFSEEGPSFDLSLGFMF